MRSRREGREATHPAPAVGTPRRAGRPRRVLVVAALGLAVVAGSVGLAACGDDSAELPDGVVAQVGDVSISEKQLDRVLVQAEAAATAEKQSFPEEGSDEYAAYRRQAAQQLVERGIIGIQVKKCGEPCAVTEKEVDARLQQLIKEQYQNKRANLEKDLKKYKVTLAELRQRIKESLQQPKLQDHIVGDITVTAADAREYYNGNRSQFRQPATRDVSHILVKTKAQADRIRAQVTKANFAELARQNSIDTGTKPNGGALGPSQKGQFVAEFDKVAFSIPVGTISKPVRTQYGWHIIMVTKATPAKTTPFAAAREQIIAQQTQAKQQEAFQKWNTEVYTPLLEDTKYADDVKPEPTTATTTPETPVQTTP